MSPDAFLYAMSRFEEDIAEHPEMLKQIALENELQTTMEQMFRDLVELIEILKK